MIKSAREDGTGSGESKKKRRGRRKMGGERKGERIVLEMEKLRGFEAREWKIGRQGGEIWKSELRKRKKKKKETENMKR